VEALDGSSIASRELDAWGDGRTLLLRLLAKDRQARRIQHVESRSPVGKDPLVGQIVDVPRRGRWRERSLGVA